MWRKKIAKGQYGYIAQQKKWSTARTLILFALSLSIFIIGIISTGSKENLLTVVAVLGCLPAGRSAVNTIMFLRARGCSKEAKEKISLSCGEITQLYDMFFTSYEKNYQVSHMVVQDNIVCGYSESPKTDGSSCEKHLDTYLKQGGCKGVAIKIFDDIEKYCEGLANLQKQKPSQVKGGLTGQEQEILDNLLSISL